MIETLIDILIVLIPIEFILLLHFFGSPCGKKKPFYFFRPNLWHHWHHTGNHIQILSSRCRQEPPEVLRTYREYKCCRCKKTKRGPALDSWGY